MRFPVRVWSRLAVSAVALFGLITGLQLLFGASPALAFSGSGIGTSGDPYQITTCAQLEEIDNDLTADYELTQDVDCTGSASLNSSAGFIPIGNGLGAFTGTLDGQDHAILSLDIPGDTSSNSWGLFASLGGNAVVSNLEIRNGSVTGNGNVGMIVGVMNGSSQLTRVISSAAVNSTGSNTGGLVGTMHDDTSITASSSVGDVTSTGGETYGGLVGWADGQSGHTITITNVYHRGTISATSSVAYTGGLIGFATYTSLTLGYNAGSVQGTSGVGGIAGAVLSSTVTDMFAAASFSGTATDVGPFLGDNLSNTLNNDYFDTVIASVGTDSISNATPISDSTYFYTSTNAVFTNWSFPTVWRENYEDYPSLVPMRSPQMECEEVVVTLSTIHAHCIIDPPGWGTPTWVMRYRKASASTWKNVTLADIHLDDATITGLTSGTAYVVQFQFTDDFGTGPWGTIDATTLGVAPSSPAAASTAAITTSYASSTTINEETTPVSPAKQASDMSQRSATNNSHTPTSQGITTSWATVSVTIGLGVIVILVVLSIFGRRLGLWHIGR